MVAPTFKKATDTAPGDATKYGAPDLKYAFDVLDGSHASHRVQVGVIEGVDRFATFAFFVKQVGSVYQAFRCDTGALFNSDADFGVLMNTVIGALPFPSTAQPIGIIYVSGTTLDCTSTSITVDKPVIIDGMGSAIIRKTTDYVGVSRSVFNITSGNVTIRDLVIDITIQIGSASRGINCEPSAASVQNTLIDHVRILKAHQGIYLHAAVGTTHQIEHAIIRDCMLDNTGTTLSGGAGITVGLGCEHVIIEHNLILEPGAAGIDVVATREHIKISANTIKKLTNTGGGAGVDVTDIGSTTSIVGNPTQFVVIRDNDIEFASTASVACIRVRGGAQKVIVINNFLKGSVSDGVAIIPRTVSAVDYHPTEVNVSGNLISSIGRHGVYIDMGGINTATFQGFQVTHNYINGTQQNGIHFVSTVLGANVTSNIITRYGLDLAADRTGILLRNGTNNTIVTGNKINGLGVGGTNYTAVREEGTVSNNTIVNNSVNYSISTTSSSTVVLQNDGYKTENSGTVSISSGTSVTFNHGLGGGQTPGLKDIMVTPTTSISPATRFWVSSITSTQVTITVNATATPTFAWQIIRGVS